MAYPADISDIPWERNMQRDLMALTLLVESRQSLEIVTHSLGQLVDVYQKLGLAMYTFVDVMRKGKETMMGPNKWEAVKERVTTTMAKSMFNFKEGPKRKMLKVKYFKHPNIAHYLYDRHLAAYGRLPWNDKVPLYFVKIFCAELYLGMKPNYNDLPSDFFGLDKIRLCHRRGTKHDTKLSRPESPLVSRPLHV